MEPYTNVVLNLLAGGASLEEALARLKTLGATPVETIKALRVAQGVDLREAKELYVNSAAWAVEVKANEVLLLEALALLDRTS